MAQDGVTNTGQMIVVSTVEGWLSFKSLLQHCSGDKNLQVTFSSKGSNQTCDLTVDGRSFNLHNAELKEDITEECISQALDGCFQSCTDQICTFLLLIQGGRFTKRERRMIEILQCHFGAEALKFLVVLSLEDGTDADKFDNTLLELMQMCNRRYSKITSFAAKDKLRSLFEMVDHMLTENGVTGYTEAMLTEAKKRSLENSMRKTLTLNSRQCKFSGLMGPEAEAEEREQEFELKVLQQEERREREMEELTAKHAEERKKEASERMQYEKKKENSKEAVISHRAMLQPKMNPTDDENTKTTSVILLGLSGSGKSSALNLILEIAGNQYFINESSPGNSLPTLSCERKEVFKSGRKLILVDTPELWDEDGVENLDLVKDCLSLSLPGPHVFLVVLQVGRFTHGECEMLMHLQKMFGRELTEYAIVLFVSFDDSQQRPQGIDDYVEEAHVTLQDLIRKCGSRFYELNVTKSQSALSFPQVKDLLLGINKLVASHGGQAYSGRRFSMQELRERRKHIEEMKEGALENDSLLRET